MTCKPRSSVLPLECSESFMIFSFSLLQEFLWISLQTGKMNEGDEGNMDDFLPETIDRGGKRKAEEVDFRRSQEQFPRHSLLFVVILNPLHFYYHSCSRLEILSLNMTLNPQASLHVEITKNYFMSTSIACGDKNIMINLNPEVLHNLLWLLPYLDKLFNFTYVWVNIFLEVVYKYFFYLL